MSLLLAAQEEQEYDIQKLQKGIFDDDDDLDDKYIVSFVRKFKKYLNKKNQQNNSPNKG